MPDIFPSGFWTLIAVGTALHFLGYFWLLFAAYREDIPLARLMVFVPAVSLLFAGRHPRAAIIPAILQIAGAVFWCLAMNKVWVNAFPN